MIKVSSVNIQHHHCQPVNYIINLASAAANKQQTDEIDVQNRIETVKSSTATY